jgi:membrane protease YdiL (CAAX protease family)
MDSRIRTFLPWAAAVFFSLLFHFRGLGPLDFWWGMGTVIAVLIGTAVFADASFTRSLQEDLKVEIARKVALGVLTAAFLYGVFYLGNGFARSFLPFAGDNIGAVYGLRSGVSPLRVGLLLAFLIGPGEELFWRGWLQRSWQERFGPAALPFTAALYAAVHIASGNPMLILAAAVCGVYWGFLYRRFNSVLLVAVSHTIWDLMVFLLLPFTAA